jgi:hypothetical protein
MTDLEAAAREIAHKAMKESLAHNGAIPDDVSDYTRTINIFSKAITQALAAVRDADAQRHAALAARLKACEDERDHKVELLVSQTEKLAQARVEVARLSDSAGWWGRATARKCLATEKLRDENQRLRAVVEAIADKLVIHSNPMAEHIKHIVKAALTETPAQRGGYSNDEQQ